MASAPGQPSDINSAEPWVAFTTTPNAAWSNTVTRDATIEANAWKDHSVALAEWARRWLVNREDAYGGYLRCDRRTGRQNSYTAKRVLSAETLRRHFCGFDVGDLIGLHAIALDNTCRWVGVDLDQHGESNVAVAAGNLDAAFGLFDLATTMGYVPLLTDSNGRGGYHLRVFFDPQIASERAFGFGIWLANQAQRLGLQKSPESFPKQPRLTGKKPYGNWMRLPGRHHTRDHWSSVWAGTDWATGERAIELILATAGRPATMLPTVLPTPSSPAPSSPAHATPIPDGDDDRNPVQRVLRQLQDASPSGDGWIACCPAHNDTRPSLSIGVGERGKVLLYCHAGCNIDKIVAALGLEIADLFASLPCGRRQGTQASAYATMETAVRAGLAAVAIPTLNASGTNIVGTSLGTYPPGTNTAGANTNSANVGSTDDGVNADNGISIATFGIWQATALPNDSVTTKVDWDRLMLYFEAALRPEHLKALARSLGLPETSMHNFRLGWKASDRHGPCWVVAETDATGHVIGIQRRYADGTKRLIKGGQRGLVVPRDWGWRPPPLFAPEGFSDAAAIVSLGRLAIGRPSATGGIKKLAAFLANIDVPVIIVGDNDEKDGVWPGRDGARVTASKLTELLRREVKWSMPPLGFKDIRESIVGAHNVSRRERPDN